MDIITLLGFFAIVLIIIWLILIIRWLIRRLKTSEWWNSKPYWFKGGIVGLIVGILLFIPVILLIFCLSGCRGESCAGCGGFLLFGIPGIFILIFSVLILIFGTLIGWIKGKRKSKKEQV